MPEGDTIARIAAALRPDWVGHAVRAARCRWEGVIGGLVGRRIERIETIGKHMLVAFDDATLLRVHLGLHGTWHRYLHGERWHRPASQMTLVLDTDEYQFVCFGAPTAERLRAKEVPGHPTLSELGPDLLASPDLAEVVRRTRERGNGRAASEVLLDQRIACGLGNVYKSDVLFLLGIAPQRAADDLDDATWTRIWGLAAELLTRNADRPRATREGRGPRTWVYGRAGRPCLRCGAIIASSREDRVTFWCPGCQPG